jgi:hypothetical protein
MLIKLRIPYKQEISWPAGDLHFSIKSSAIKFTIIITVVVVVAVGGCSC